MPNIELVNMGIAVVVPVSKILEVLNRQDLLEKRGADEEKLRKK